MNSPTIEPNGTVDSDPYAQPEKFCDLVMKGGITSGVVYPAAVCELAKTYSFKNIGGASAGAIAAATAAAAEYGRRTGAKPDGSNGFARLEKVPDWLARNLSSLFQPNPKTRPLYNIVLKAIGGKGGMLRKTMVLLPAAWRNFFWWALSGLVVGLLLLLPVVDFLPRPTNSVAWWVLYGYGGFMALLFVLLVVTVFVMIGLVRRVTRALPENNYGLVSGLLDPQGNDRHPPLTTWMADELDRLAGKDRAHPLTFGDLRGATGELDKRVLGAKHGGINLEMMTTNLTLGRPYRLPFDKSSTEYFYNPAEWSKFFPEHIVDWMLKHPRQSTHPPGARRERQLAEWESFKPCLPLPAPDDLPIVVAARMSLSFPVLISAVPLYTVDRSLPVPEGDEPKLERCLFSDGGISSNFPIHFFDKALPRWPTFGINLASFNPAYPCDPED
ncbi:MAG TPA: patatin-like phospholipase family protein, partial [Pyrinomonadaceae bacterium]|nr:patatin-like phospholipase family protein [Pyrinomonadaceae bacterium]